MSESRDEMGLKLVALARETVAGRLEGRTADPSQDLIDTFRESAGTFVTIRKRSGELRGCIGTQRPTCDSVADEVVRVAPLAAFQDPRFPPIQLDEIDDLHFEVSILTPSSPVDDIAELDPARWGIIVEDDRGRRAILLPGITSIETVEEQLHAIRQKAGIPSEADIRIRRFEIEKFEEDE